MWLPLLVIVLVKASSRARNILWRCAWPSELVELVVNLSRRIAIPFIEPGMFRYLHFCDHVLFYPG
jgi:hypothetical protein